MYKNILITGAAGFIGSNLIEFLLVDNKITDINFIMLDNLSYCGNLRNLEFAEKFPNYKFIKGDICDEKLLEKIIEDHKIDSIIHLAAESHVDRSIMDSTPFLNNNVLGTLRLLDACKKFNLKRYLQVSTDEVYGSLNMEEPGFTERHNISPNSPYAASKAAADHFVHSYFVTHKSPVLITRCSNNYGPKQFPEKLIPLMILNALNDKDLPVYGDGMNVRDWIYVKDHCSAIWKVFLEGKIGEVYNIGALCEKTNLEIIKTILNILVKSEKLIKFVKDRPGHDRRYAMDINKIKNELNWAPLTEFEKGIELTVSWYQNNIDWSDEIISGKYLEYYKKQYEER